MNARSHPPRRLSWPHGDEWRVPGLPRLNGVATRFGLAGEQLLATGRHHPVCAVDMAADSLAGEVLRPVNAENEIGHVLDAGIVGAGIEDAQINGAMLPVVARDVV